MEPELIAALIGGAFAILAAILPFIIKRKEKRQAEASAAEGLAAVIGVVQRGDEVLMVRRRTRYRGLSWQFPAGVLKPGEDMNDKVEDEVADETGVRCKVKKYLGARVHEETRVLCHYFHCLYLDGTAENRDEKENSEVAWVKASAVDTYVTSSLFREVAALLEALPREPASAAKNVVLGVVLHNERVLLVQKIDTGQDVLWQLPGGTVEPHETDQAAITREVREETGIHCSVVEKLGERIHPDSNQSITYWLCRYLSGQAALREPDKFFGVQWVARDEAITLLGENLFEPVKQVLQDK